MVTTKTTQCLNIHISQFINNISGRKFLPWNKTENARKTQKMNSYGTAGGTEWVRQNPWKEMNVDVLGRDRSLACWQFCLTQVLPNLLSFSDLFWFSFRFHAFTFFFLSFNLLSWFGWQVSPDTRSLVHLWLWRHKRQQMLESEATIQSAGGYHRVDQHL